MLLDDLVSLFDHKHANYPVQILTEDGDVFDVADVEFDKEAQTTYIKCELVDETPSLKQ